MLGTGGIEVEAYQAPSAMPALHIPATPEAEAAELLRQARTQGTTGAQYVSSFLEAATGRTALQ